MTRMNLRWFFLFVSGVCFIYVGICNVLGRTAPTVLGIGWLSLAVSLLFRQSRNRREI